MDARHGAGPDTVAVVVVVVGEAVLVVVVVVALLVALVTGVSDAELVAGPFPLPPELPHAVASSASATSRADVMGFFRTMVNSASSPCTPKRGACHYPGTPHGP
jgi:hypothetical protein